MGDWNIGMEFMWWSWRNAVYFFPLLSVLSTIIEMPVIALEYGGFLQKYLKTDCVLKYAVHCIRLNYISWRHMLGFRLWEFDATFVMVFLLVVFFFKFRVWYPTHLLENTLSRPHVLNSFLKLKLCSMILITSTFLSKFLRKWISEFLSFPHRKFWYQCKKQTTFNKKRSQNYFTNI